MIVQFVPIPSMRRAAGMLLAVGALLAPTAPHAQQAAPAAAPSSAGVQGLAWLSGDWEATMPNGALNETRFMAPRDGVMTGVMRLTKDGTLLVQELLAIVEIGGKLEMRLRHFGRALNPLETAPIVLTLATMTAGGAEFEGIYNGAPMRSTVRKTGPDGWKGESTFQGRDGKPVTIASVFTRRAGADDPAGAPRPTDEADVADTSFDAPDGTRVLRQSITVPASLQDVWTALTTAEGLRTWAVPFARVDFRLGGIWESSYRLDATAGDPANIKNRFIAYAPMRMVTIQAVQAPPGFPHPELLPHVWTVIELEPIGERLVRVTAAGIGYRDTPQYRRLYEFFERGNAWTLHQLYRRFTSGPVDWKTVTPAKN